MDCQIVDARSSIEQEPEDDNGSEARCESADTKRLEYEKEDDDTTRDANDGSGRQIRVVDASTYISVAVSTICGRGCSFLTLDCTKNRLSWSKDTICHDAASSEDGNHSNGKLDGTLVFHDRADRSID